MPSYLPIVILGAIALGFGVVVLTLSYVIGRPRPDSAKLSTYECGMPPVGTARERFPIKFYLVCMLFILFDVETAFFYPWALVFQLPTYATYALGAMAVFFTVLAVGFIYEWKVGAMDW
jgi:NADH-quinone oxidoreductase subunit A